jgi:hypothetical protein
LSPIWRPRSAAGGCPWMSPPRPRSPCADLVPPASASSCGGRPRPCPGSICRTPPVRLICSYASSYGGRPSPPTVLASSTRSVCPAAVARSDGNWLVGCRSTRSGRTCPQSAAPLL